MNNEISIEEFKKIKSKPKGLLFMESLLRDNCIVFIPEFKFCDTRKFKADIAFRLGEHEYLLEYEGLPLRGSKSGHVTITGYTSNCEKYNLAALMGYKVLRYTALNYKQFEQDLIKIKE